MRIVRFLQVLMVLCAVLVGGVARAEDEQAKAAKGFVEREQKFVELLTKVQQ